MENKVDCFPNKRFRKLELYLFTCEECDKIFNKIINMKDHMKNEHGDGYLIHAKQRRAN